MTNVFELPTYEECPDLRDFVFPERIERIVLYHGTSTKFRKKIIKEGLRPSRETGNYVQGIAFTDGDRVYLGREVAARAKADETIQTFGGRIIVVKAIVDAKGLVIDDKVLRFKYVSDWKESMRHFDTCAYMGTIKDVGIIG
ncbi:MAG: hypothetical protein JW716_02530 [Candidatus Aenigmarchaeota archaeon]|nr:hypothetical protein [Candidatus Aenigmarchaeota archaeon]